MLFCTLFVAVTEWSFSLFHGGILMAAISPQRYAALEEAYGSMRHLFQFLARYRSGCTLLDVGSGEGVLSLKIAQDLKAQRIVLVDNHYPPVIDLPPHAEFYFADVLSEEFVHRFQNQANVVVCQCVLHEVLHPAAAATNLIRVLPIQGVGLILDYTEAGWGQLRAEAKQGKEHSVGHFEQDTHNLSMVRQQWGIDLGTDTGIRDFWESFFPRVPGECVLTFSGGVYSVLYIPKQWGEVKQPPLDIAAVLRSRRR